MIRKLVWIGTIIGIYFLVGVMIEGCSKPKPVTATAPAAVEDKRFTPPPCPEGTVLVSWVPGTPIRPNGVPHGTSSSATIIKQLPNGVLECRKQ